MAYKSTVYQILIASPSDVVAERKAIPEVIYSWNAVNSNTLKVVLLPVMWETHSTPEIGDRPQAIINKQIVENCDILIGTFWTRIGTYTGVAESGTVEEIEKFKKAGKPVMLYFSSMPVVPDSINTEQYELLTSFKRKCQEEGLIDQYSSIGELREKLNRHLTTVIRNIHRTNDNILLEKKIDEKSQELPMIKEQFNSLLRRYEAEWTSERDSEPLSIDEGKYILKELGSNLLEFRSMLYGKVNEKVITTIDEIIKDCKVIQKHRLMINGGKSYGEFWEFGDSLIQRLKELINVIS